MQNEILYPGIIACQLFFFNILLILKKIVGTVKATKVVIEYGDYSCNLINDNIKI